ncbi:MULTISPECIES: ABC transporter ATP-binding protein [Turicibacter]|jgi:ABC transporter, ATP-binding protein|uniref:ABC transporter ATP-binding protein n=1 Tax=Turicibacter TaxID=191303 RepID=UPI0001FDB365|nr:MULTISPECIES: ABC transporter ATP-binding protein [Turicibacter]EGC91648.1 ABC transporter, ATP-binding protein [Turicibacter sp. HGF1]MBP3905391.1 ABC transporter ATP-binding protein [Turicibacter sp.]MCU7197175.1 ABC transporter ATP-binding protein/permease [Turicibacter sanguinis]MCU7203246.1 ABC transporter ATP-binding protein/permease [Turicibacter sanguinis]MDB8439011.1 ABC transporter ATP-binding protein [Turicibacter sanguinis]
MLKLFKGLKPYWLMVVGVLILVFISTMTDLALPDLMSDIVDTGIVQGDVSYILGRGGVMLAVALLGTVCIICSSYLSSRIGIGFSRDLRKKVFEKVESFSLTEVNTVGTASLITRTTNDINQVQQVTIMMMRMMLSAPLMIVGALIMALRKDVGLSTIILVVIPIIVVVIGVIAKFTMPMFEKMQKRIDKLNLVVRENLTGIRVVRVFNKVDFEQKRFNQASSDLSRVATTANRLMGSLMPLMMLILNISIVAVLWFGGIRINEGSFQVGDLMAFIQYLTQVLFSMLMLTMMFVLIPRAQASAVRINEVLEMESPIQNPANGAQPSLKGVVEFKNVAFGYEGAEEHAISNISFKANPGEITAIIGGTGSGKSTLLNMIPRFYDAAEGEVLVDGVNVREMNQALLRSKIGYVPQKAILFTGTIRDNIRYGKEDATDEEIKHALDIAQATDFVSKMPDGLESPIAQGGTNVSGGQKQRLSIARAIVRKPEIYLFDDSFSALDFKTDAQLRAALKAETKEATVIIVAQRVSTVMDADRILVMDEGRIAGCGTHEELLATNEIYQQIVESQLKQGEEE